MLLKDIVPRNLIVNTNYDDFAKHTEIVDFDIEDLVDYVENNVDVYYWINLESVWGKIGFVWDEYNVRGHFQSSKIPFTYIPVIPDGQRLKDLKGLLQVFTSGEIHLLKSDWSNVTNANEIINSSKNIKWELNLEGINLTNKVLKLFTYQYPNNGNSTNIKIIGDLSDIYIYIESSGTQFIDLRNAGKFNLIGCFITDYDKREADSKYKKYIVGVNSFVFIVDKNDDLNYSIVDNVLSISSYNAFPNKDINSLNYTNIKYTSTINMVYQDGDNYRYINDDSIYSNVNAYNNNKIFNTLKFTGISIPNDILNVITSKYKNIRVGIYNNVCNAKDIYYLGKGFIFEGNNYSKCPITNYHCDKDIIKLSDSLGRTFKSNTESWIKNKNNFKCSNKYILCVWGSNNMNVYDENLEYNRVYIMPTSNFDCSEIKNLKLYHLFSSFNYDNLKTLTVGNYIFYIPTPNFINGENIYNLTFYDAPNTFPIKDNYNIFADYIDMNIFPNIKVFKYNSSYYTQRLVLTATKIINVYDIILNNFFYEDSVYIYNLYNDYIFNVIPDENNYFRVEYKHSSTDYNADVVKLDITNIADEILQANYIIYRPRNGKYVFCNINISKSNVKRVGNISLSNDYYIYNTNTYLSYVNEDNKNNALNFYKGANNFNIIYISNDNYNILGEDIVNELLNRGFQFNIEV